MNFALKTTCLYLMKRSGKWASNPNYTGRGSGGKPSFAEYCGRLGDQLAKDFALD
jgi:hypothetical protein